MQERNQASEAREANAVPKSLDVAAAIAWRVLVVAAAVAALAFTLATLRVIFLPFVVALLLATVFAPPVRWLRQQHVPSAIATLAVLLGTLALLAGAITLAAPYIARQVDEFGELGQQVRQGVDRTLDWAVEGPLGLEEGQVRRLVDRADRQLREQLPGLTGGALAGAVILVEVVAGVILAFVLLFFFLHGGREMWEWATRLFPRERRRHVDEMGQRVWTALGHYVRAQVLVALVDAVLIGGALVVLGVPLAIPLAVLIFFGAFVPVIGAFVTGFVAVMVALASQGFTSALIVLGWTLLVQQLEGNVLEPYIVGRYVKLHPVAILLAVAAGAVIWGIPGAFLAAPLLATVNAAGSYLAGRGQADGGERERGASEPRGAERGQGQPIAVPEAGSPARTGRRRRGGRGGGE